MRMVLSSIMRLLSLSQRLIRLMMVMRKMVQHGLSHRPNEFAFEVLSEWWYFPHQYCYCRGKPLAVRLLKAGSR